MSRQKWATNQKKKRKRVGAKEEEGELIYTVYTDVTSGRNSYWYVEQEVRVIWQKVQAAIG